MISSPANTPRLNGLDHLRTLAITLVLLFHYSLFPHPAWMDNLFQFGWTGVDLFFVLSGYLISSQLFTGIVAGQGIDVQGFYVKRFFRIIPAYLFIVIVYYTVPAFTEWGHLPPLWRMLTFTQNLGLDLRTSRTFSHAWSLCIEEQFYLVLPVILAILYYRKWLRAGAIILSALFIAEFLLRLCSWNKFIVPVINTDDFVVEWYKWIYYPTYNRLDGLLTGIALAAAIHFRPGVAGLLVRGGNWLLLAAIALLGVSYIICLDQHSFMATVFGFPVVSIGYGLLVAAAISPSCFLSRYSSRITVSVATLSYSIYLCHKGIIHLTQQYLSAHGIAADSTWTFLVCIFTVLIAATLMNRLIERPFLILRQKLLKSRS